MIKLKKRMAVSGSYNWRPDFRDFETLPDLRTVRTQFFLIPIFVTIAALFLGLILFREYKAMGISEDIAALQAEIEGYKTEHDAKVKLNAEFMGVMRNVEEVVEFKSGKLIGSDFLLAVSSRLPDEVFLERVEYGETRAVVEGNVKVAATEASQIVNAYLKALEEGEVLQGRLTEYKLTSLKRDDRSGQIKFRIEVTAKE